MARALLCAHAFFIKLIEVLLSRLKGAASLSMMVFVESEYLPQPFNNTTN